jgi:predicted DNA-binding transcriptional regulator AlpA
MTSDGMEDRLKTPRLQGDLAKRSTTTPGYFPAPRGADVIRLVDLDEIQQRWGVSENKVYRAVALGYIRAYGRPGRQKYYSAAEIEAWLSSSVNGR